MTPLINALTNKTATIGIIGLGYVGLPLALAYAKGGYKVLGFDVNEALVDGLKAGKSPINHIPSQDVAAAMAGQMDATTDFSRASEVDAVILCVPTPLGAHHEPDLSYVTKSMESVLPHLKKPVAISLESTTYPGTTDEEIVPRLEAAGFTIGEDAFVVYSPEREDPGRKSHHTATIPKLCGGVTKACLDTGMALYAQVIEQVVPVSSAKVAEAAKLLENIYRAVNIGLMNEMKMVTDKMGIDIYEVIEAAATKPYGFTPFYPGPGIGGHCIPIDPFYFTWKAKEVGIHTHFIELAGEINRNMPEWVVRKSAEALNMKKKAINGAKILILGLAYKPNVDDLRESPSLDIIKLLEARGGDVSYHDPFIPTFKPTRHYAGEVRSETLTPELLASVDCVILSTHHDAEHVDYEMVMQHAPLILDTRGHLPKEAENVVRI